jgi:Kae1-associated kinase Bud32
MKLIGEGAEAQILKKDKDLVIKKRVLKNYRISIIDIDLRKKRTKKEIKIMSKLYDLGFSVPKIYNTDIFSIEMEFLQGTKVRECLEKDTNLIAVQIGKFLAELHNNDIVHGDLTTSNMVYDSKNVYFLDFGLSQFSTRVEDKAVDLHLLKSALLSYHYNIFDSVFELIIGEYMKICKNSDIILKRLALVESRGRNKKKEKNTN